MAKKSFNENKIDKVMIKFDIRMLEMMIGYIFKRSVQVNRKSLNNLKKLFSIIDPMGYNGNEKMEARIWVINRALEARLDLGFESDDMIINYCRTDVPNNENDEILKNIPIYTKLNYDELRFIGNAVEDRLKYAYLINYKDSLYRSMERLDTGSYNSFKEINTEFMSICSDFVAQSRKISTLDDTQSISLTDDDFSESVQDIVTKLKNPSRIFTTGIQKFNEILSPGFLGGRLYCIMGLPAGFKSGLLLKIMRDIKKYNAGLQSEKPGKTPTVLMVTMENSVEETVERLFNMVAAVDDIRNYTPKQVVKLLQKEGEMVVTDANNIDIVVKYKANRSIDTADLYTMVDDLEDDGREVISLVLDYIKRIRPAEYAKDEKEELKNVTNELKTLALDYGIPVITAHQLNRSGAATIDAAMEADKTDLAKFVGRSNVGSALSARARKNFLTAGKSLELSILNHSGDIMVAHSNYMRYSNKLKDWMIRIQDSYFNEEKGGIICI